MRLDFDDWTSQITQRMNVISKLMVSFEERMQTLETQIKKLIENDQKKNVEIC